MAIPLTVIGGFLGAGKTTLVNHLLRGEHGRRIAVMVNDFGEINIDAELIAGRAGDTISLANGCICCSIGDSLMLALIELLRRPDPPEHLVIEASGVADPARIAEIGLADPGFRLDGVVVVVDAERIRDQAADRHVGETVRRQLAAADIIALNKIDLVGANDRTALRTWLHREVEGARVCETERSRIPPEILIGDPAPRVPRAVPAHDHGAAFASWRFTSERPFDRVAFQAATATLPPSVLRAKGVLFIADDPERQTVFQMVGRRRELERGASWPAKPASRLVVIGLPSAIDPPALEESFGRALA